MIETDRYTIEPDGLLIRAPGVNSYTLSLTPSTASAVGSVLGVVPRDGASGEESPMAAMP